jgi:phosphatidylserine/phosphatidylglycerophosphate/cardiolipin synthase-like enzyme
LEALYWQARVIISILGLYFLVSRWNKKLAIGFSLAMSCWWSWFTNDHLSGKLFYFQFSTIWVSFFVGFYLYRKEALIKQKDITISELEGIVKELQSVIKDFPQNEQALIQKSLRGSPLQKIEGDEHSKFLKVAISRAEQSVIILSGWILNNVVDEKFSALLKTAVRDGTSILIGYGFDSYGNDNEINHDHMVAIDRLKKIEVWSQNEKGNLVVQKIEKSHEKLILCDNLYTVIGSINWLSNTGKNTKELSVKIESKELTSELKKRTVAKFN